MTGTTDSASGRTVAGRYTVVRKIADGGMASVYEAEDNRLGRTVALKIMHAGLAQSEHSEEYTERFHREARSAASISNPHIVPVYDTGMYEGRSFLVMELIHGVTLRQEMNVRKNFSIHDTIRILTQVLDGLAAAHQSHVIHRDIKPENIMIATQGVIKITDFGLAKATSQATLSSTGMLLGTASYLAPETIENNYSSTQTDLYSVGIMGWEMVTGHVPFISGNPVTVVFRHVHDDVPALESIDPSVPHTFSGFIASLAARKPEDRPEDAAEALRRIRILSRSLFPAQLAVKIPYSAGPGNKDVPSGTGKLGHQIRQAALPSHTDTPSAASSSTARTVRGSRNSGDPRYTTDTWKEMTRPAPVPPYTAHDRRSSTAGRLPAADGAGPSSGPSGTSAAQETVLSRSRKMPSRLRRILIGAGLLAAAAIAAVLWWIFAGPGSYYILPVAADGQCTSNATTSAQSCTIRNSDFAAYRSALESSGIPYTASYAYSDTVPKGKIISSSPDTAGTHISKRGGHLTIVVSRGIKMITIPSDITDPKTSNGKNPLAALKKLGFTNISHDGSKDSYSLTIPKGAAISISPSPGKTLRHNARIEIALSLGKKAVAMPDIEGLKWNKAKAMLDEAKLKVTMKEEYSSTVDKGHVISASLKAGAQIHWNDTVTVVVSKGPETVTVPDVTGMDFTRARSVLEDMGFTVVQKNTLGIGKTVSSQSIEAGNRITIMDGSGKPREIVLTVSLFSW